MRFKEVRVGDIVRIKLDARWVKPKKRSRDALRRFKYRGRVVGLWDKPSTPPTPPTPFTVDVVSIKAGEYVGDFAPSELTLIRRPAKEG